MLGYRNKATYLFCMTLLPKKVEICTYFVSLGIYIKDPYLKQDKHTLSWNWGKVGDIRKLDKSKSYKNRTFYVNT